jgi:hypothetical protein
MPDYSDEEIDKASDELSDNENDPQRNFIDDNVRFF